MNGRDILPPMSRVTVVNLRSLSYSGTSWVNLVLGSHPGAIAIGPPDRIWKLPVEEAEERESEDLLLVQASAEGFAFATD